jgi:glycerophosphoryl diester phosphodiesterase
VTSSEVLSAVPEQNVQFDPFARSYGGQWPGAFVITGHRGAMTLAPENSALSFHLAACHADEIELDIRTTADGVPIVVHDATLSRLAAGAHPFRDVPVDQLSLAQVRSVPLTSGQMVLTLADVLDIVEVQLQVEIKDPAAVPGIADLLSTRPGPLPRIRFSSFLPEALLRLQRHLPDVPRGLIIAAFPGTASQQEELSATLARTGATTLYSGFGNLSRLHVEGLRSSNIDVHVWPLASFEDIHRGLALLAAGGTADDPGRARGWLDSQSGPAWLPPLQGSMRDLKRGLPHIPQDCSG